MQFQVEVENANSVLEVFDAISYKKGSSLVRMLKEYLGDEIFQVISKNTLLINITYVLYPSVCVCDQACFLNLEIIEFLHEEICIQKCKDRGFMECSYRRIWF